MSKVIPVTDKELLQKHGVYFSVGTLYKWHHEGTHPELFLKLGRKLLLNLDEYNKWINNAEKQTQARAKRIKALKQ